MNFKNILLCLLLFLQPTSIQSINYKYPWGIFGSLIASYYLLKKYSPYFIVYKDGKSLFKHVKDYKPDEKIIATYISIKPDSVNDIQEIKHYQDNFYGSWHIDIHGNYLSIDGTPLHAWASSYESLSINVNELIQNPNSIPNILLKKMKNPNIRNNLGQHALHYALVNERSKKAYILALLGLDIHLEDNNGITVAHRAFESGYIKLIDYLIKNNVNLKCVTNSRHTMLHYWAKARAHNCRHYEDKLKKWNKLGKKLLDHTNLNAQDCKGNTVLHVSIKFGTKATKMLLNYENIDINIQNNKGNTPLHEAIINGDTKVSKLLIDLSNNLDIKNNDDYTPLMLAVTSKQKKVTHKLLKKGANINLKYPENETVLSIAVSILDSKTVKRLLEYGADRDLLSKNSGGYTSYHELARTTKDLNSSKHKKRRLKIANLFKQYQNNAYSIKNNKGETPLYIAIKKGSDLSLPQFILQNYNSDINTVDNNGLSPLHVAASIVCPKTIRFLIANHANTNQQIEIKENNQYKSTPLHLLIEQLKEHPGAAESQQPRVFKSIAYLLLYANPHIKNNKQQNPLDLARKLDNEMWANFIQDPYNINPELMNKIREKIISLKTNSPNTKNITNTTQHLINKQLGIK